MARQNLLFNILFQCFRVADNAQQPGNRHMAVNQRLGLITFELGRVFRVSLEIPPLQQSPVDLVKIVQVRIVIRPLIVRAANKTYR